MASTTQASAEYVGRSACIACHAAEAAAFAGSHHDLAMQAASEETVLGDFDDAVFEGASGTTTFRREGAAYLVETLGPDGTLASFPVRWVYGVEPLQQVLIELEEGRVQCLTVAWDADQGRWYDLYPDEAIEPGDELHWTGRYQRWNTMCAACHSTDLRKNYDLETDGYQTSFEELDVSCEACHGPGSEHLAWAADSARESEGQRGLTHLLRRGEDPGHQVETCAPCHSRRSELVARPQPGLPFLDQFLPERLHEGLYFPDGQIQDEVYVWGSFVQSKMHAQGVACSDCHDPHSLELWVPGDAVCLQCHSEAAPLERFPSLTTKNYATPEHHGHPQESEGARCVVCHMPERTYMGIDERRDHSLRIPRPDVARRLGTPDACAACHEDQPATWAEDAIAQWTGSAPSHESFAEALSLGRRGDPRSVPLLLRWIQAEDAVPIVKATALELLAPFADRELQAIRAQLQHESGLVRLGAVRGLELLPLPLRTQELRALLHDPLLAVRSEAARVLADANPSTWSPADRKAWDRAEEEYLTAQRVAGDFPASHLNLGVHAERTGRGEEALAAYRQAISHDIAFLPARFNAATLLASLGRPQEAREVLLAGLEFHENEGELHYSIGLIQAELGDTSRSAVHLARAADLMPTRPRVQYNAALAAQGVGWTADAERFHRRALQLASQDPDVVYAAALFFAESGATAQAQDLAQHLVEITQGAPFALQLRARLAAPAGKGSTRR